MAYSKIYSRINWENEPSTASPINENNLNRMDSALNTLDDRVVELSQNVETLQGYETRVAGLVAEAQTAKNQAQSSATTSTNQATLSKSYAIGGTGARSGEATDNAKYYKEQAEQAAQQAMSGTPEGYADLVAKVNSIYRQTATSYNVVGTSEGSALAHTIYGMSVQDGTPTPSVPVEIQSAKADFKCVGKNLIPYPYYRQSGYSSQGMTGTYGDDGIITINKEVGSATAYFGLHPDYKLLTPNTRYKLSMSLENTNSASVFISVNNIDIAAIRNKASGNYDYTFTTPNELLGRTQMALYFGANDVESNCKVKVMLTLADADQTYEVNKHKDITTDLTLRAIEVASTDDYTYERDGKYYIADTIDWSEDKGYQITRRVNEVIYNGTEGWLTNTVSGNRRAFFRNLSDNVPPKTQNNIIYAISNRFSATSRNNFVNNTVTNVFAQNASSLDIMFISADTSITTVAQWKTWLESNNLIVDYILATPTTESITSEQAQALLSLKTYDEATSISATGDIEPSLNLEYSKDRNTALALTGHNEAYIAQELEGVYGVKNLIPYPYYDTSKTINGLTFTDNSDGSVTINGTCTGQTFYQLWGGRNNLITTYFLTENENYIMTLDVDGDINLSSGDCCLCFRTYPQNSTTPSQDVFYITKITDNIREQFTFTQPDGYIYSLLWLEFRTGAVLNNVTIKPMLRLASIQSDEYQPYAMSNYELTKKIKELETALIELSSQ